MIDSDIKSSGDESKMSTAILPDWPSSSSYVYDDVSGHIATFKETTKLFIEEESFEIQACIADSQKVVAHDASSLDELAILLNKSGLRNASVKDTNKLPTIHVFLLRQKSSRGLMIIPETAMKYLLHEVQASSALAPILTCFGTEDGPYTGGRSSYFARDHGRGSADQAFETAYTLKYVERHGRMDRDDPWSIRQMAVYQRFETSTKRSSYIFIQASTRAEKRLAEVIGDDAVRNHWTALHQCVLGTLGYGWAQYLRFLDIKISEACFPVRYFTVGSPTPISVSPRVSFTQLQQVTEYTDILIRISHALDLNISVLERLSQESSLRQSLEQLTSSQQPNSSSAEYEDFRAALRTCVTEHVFLKQHVALVRECAERLGVALRDTIALQDSNAMLQLTHRTIYEAKSMKAITFVALVFLPASFTATFLSMGYISVDSFGGAMTLNVNRNILFYLVITLPLMAVTLLGWWLWEKKIRRRNTSMQGMGEV